MDDDNRYFNPFEDLAERDEDEYLERASLDDTAPAPLCDRCGFRLEACFCVD